LLVDAGDDFVSVIKNFPFLLAIEKLDIFSGNDKADV
jgi:hypothetical protein